MSDDLVLADAIYAAGQALHHDACTNDAHDGCDVGDWDREAEIAIRAGMPSVEHQLRVLIAREIESQQEDPTATAASTGGPASAASEGATVTDRLDEIAARAAARTDVPALVAALRAVLDLHQPGTFTATLRGEVTAHPVCPTCHDKAGVHPCGCWREVDEEHDCLGCSRPIKGAHVPWPCPTVRAVADALGVEP